MSKPRIVLVSGKAGAGKDTFANILADELRKDNLAIYQIAFADLLKTIAVKYFGWDGVKDEKGRALLQRIGTIVRKQNKDYWVEEVERMVRYVFTNADYVIISDARYLNEVEYWKEHGYPRVAINIIRPDLQSALTEEQQAHASETELDNYQFNVTVINREISDLHDEADELAMSWKYMPILFGIREKTEE